jgi:hypothetical protein
MITEANEVKKVMNNADQRAGCKIAKEAELTKNGGSL